MKISIIINYILLSLCLLLAGNIYSQDSTLEHIVVAELIAFEELPCPPGYTDPDTGEFIDVVCLSTAWEGIYKVIKTYFGDILPGTEVKFTAASHWGAAGIFDDRYALVPLATNSEDESLEVLHIWAQRIHPTNGDEFSTCGCNELLELNSQDHCAAANFDPPLSLFISGNSTFYAENLTSNQVWEINGQVANCNRGISAEIMSNDLFGRVTLLLEERNNRD